MFKLIREQIQLDLLCIKAKQLGITKDQILAAGERVKSLPWNLCTELKEMIYRVAKGESIA